MLKKIIATATTFGTSLYVFAMPALAAIDKIDLCKETGSIKLGIFCKMKLSNLITFGIQAILIAALILAFLFLVIGGLKWILSGGDKAGTEAAKGTVTAALIGLVIVFLSWMFLNIILGVFGAGGSGTPFDIPVIPSG